MTKLQVIFLMVTLLYLIAKGILFYIIYLVTLQIEAAALARQAKRRAYLEKLRGEHKVKYREAYQWYQKRLATEETLPEPEDKATPVDTPIVRERVRHPIDKEILREAYQY